jgi:histone H3/H4
MSCVVGSKIKDMLKGHDMMTAGDFTEALSKKCEMMVKEAAMRAKENGRKTVRPCDL